jgi:CDP-6-deoxy-D-xylo-4-hexulose-3-dehydrase
MAPKSAEIVPLAGAVWDRSEIDAVVEVLERHGRLRMGRRTNDFEARVAALLGKRHGIMVNSGSSALDVGVTLLELPPGSEVITPPLTFSTTVACIVHAGLVPAFVDAERHSLVIDIDRIEEMVGDRTRAMVVPNLVGNVPDWDRLREIADRRDLLLLEDSCDTLGTSLRGRPPGERADISCTSFNESHIVTCAGTGGLVAVDDERLEVEARLIRNWGRSSSRHGAGPQDFEGDLFEAEVGGVRYHRDFVFERIGHNLESVEILAAFGLVQLGKLETFAAARRARFAEHAAFFATRAEHFLLPRQLPELETTWMQYPLVVRDEAPFDREAMHRYLEQRGVIARPIWTGNILRHPGFEKIECRTTNEGYPVSDEVLRGGLLIAAHHGMLDAHVAQIHQVVDAFLAQY